MRITACLTILISLLGYCSQPSSGLKILGIFPLNSKSHFNMNERLVKGLAAKGHQVDVYSHFPQKKPLPNYTDFSLEGTMPIFVNNLSYDYVKQFAGTSFKLFLEVIGNPVCEILSTSVFQKLIKNPPKYDLVILEPFASNCYLAWGRYLNIPMIAVMTTPLMDFYNEPLGNPINTAVTPAGGSNFIPPMNFWERLTNTVMNLFFNTVFNYLIRVQDAYVEQNFGKGFPNVAELMRDLDLVLINADMSLNGMTAYTPAIVPVGGLHIADDNTTLPKDLQKWLDDSKDGCIYFTFGSMMRIETIPKPIIEALYASFKKIAPVRVLMKIAKPEELLPGLPSNIMIQSWFPQVQVLKHKNIKAFISHGGLMSTLESIYCGVPLIGIPLFADQQLNAKLNVKRGIATMIQLEDINEDKLTETIKEVIHNPTYKINVEKLSRKFVDRPMKPLDTAIFWVEYIARHGKRALRSPMVDMPWWQVRLLDVYGFIFLVLLSAFLFLRFIVKKVYNVLRKIVAKPDSRSKSKKIQ